MFQSLDNPCQLQAYEHPRIRSYQDRKFTIKIVFMLVITYN